MVRRRIPRWRAFSLLLCVVVGVVPARPAAATAFVAGHPQVRVTVAGGCPATVAGDQDVDNPSLPPGRMVPPHPSAGRICRYGPALASAAGPVSPATLYRSVRLTTATAGMLADVIDRLSTRTPTGLFSCPADFGSVTIIALSYPYRPDVDLWYHDGGCQSLDNGRLRSFEPGNRSFYAVFAPLVDRLAPPARPTP